MNEKTETIYIITWQPWVETIILGAFTDKELAQKNYEYQKTIHNSGVELVEYPNNLIISTT